MPTNWNVIVRHEPLSLLVALYVRDAADLGPIDSWPELPGVLPAAQRSAVGDAGAAVRADFQTWWNALSAFPGPHSGESGDVDPQWRVQLNMLPALEEHVAAILPEADAWAAERRLELRGLRGPVELDLRRPESLAVQKRVRKDRDRSDRRDFVFTELPLAGRGAWVGANDQVIVSRELYFDSTGYRDWLDSEFLAA